MLAGGYFYGFIEVGHYKILDKSNSVSIYNKLNVFRKNDPYAYCTGT